MKKFLVTLDYAAKEEPASEVKCTRYAISPIGAAGFLLLEDETANIKAYICLESILRMTVKDLVNDSQEVVKDKSMAAAGTMTLSSPLQITKKVTELDDEISIGDQIAVGHYTATCHKITDQGALFIMDQYDDEARPMNENGSNEGGYEESDLRKYLQSEEALKDFPDYIRERLVPFENGDLLRIPTVEEIFGEKECDYDDGSEWAEHLGGEQLPLMISRANRVAYLKNEPEWGWLQNKNLTSATAFAAVVYRGYANYNGASVVAGVRRAFLIK